MMLKGCWGRWCECVGGGGGGGSKTLTHADVLDETKLNRNVSVQLKPFLFDDAARGGPRPPKKQSQPTVAHASHKGPS